jgi:hypothetical protein
MPASVNVNGMWKYSNQTLIFFQEGQTIRALDTYRTGDRIFVWYGEGTIRGNHVHVRFHSNRSTEPDGLDSIHDFTVTPDGNTMDGMWKAVTVSASGSWSLQRIGP